MASHSIGKVFIELDLDPSRYTRAQQTLLKEAQHGATVLEKNFKNLGTKSGATFDLMRAQAVKSFEAIKKSGKVTGNELIRIEKAKAEKIRRINDQQYGHTTSMFDKIKKHWLGMTAAIVAAWYAVGGAIRKGSEVVLAAARYETLGVSMRVVGNNAGYTYQELTKLQGELEKTGISMSGARQSIIKMAQAQLDLSKATELARGAQHAAVIGAMDSTEAFNQMVYGIQSANVRVLRTIGINVSFEESYEKLEKQLGRSKETFTQAEKAGARLGVTLEALTRLSGTYEAAMETAGKQLLSLNRHFDNLKVKAGAAFTPALLEAVQTITGDIKDLNKELSGESTAKIHEWGVNFRIVLIDIKIELMNVALLLDKVGGTMTTVMVGLFSFGNAIGNENSQKQYTEWMKKNIEYKKRYWQTVIDIVELEEKQLALEYSLTDAGKAQAKVKMDALEKVRLVASEAARALEEQRVAEERAATAAKKSAKEMDKEIKKVNKELEAYYKNLAKTKEELNKFFRVELISDSMLKSVEQLKIKFEELEKQIYETFAGEELKANIAKLSEWYEIEYEEILESTKETTSEMEELWTNALDRVQSTMADTFMNAMQGKLNSFKDIFKSFCDILLRYWSEMLAQMVMQSNVLKGITAGLGGLFSGLFGGGGTALASGGGGVSPMSWASFGAGASKLFDIGKQIYAGFASALGFGGGGGASASWSMVGGFPQATPGASGAGLSFAGSSLGQWLMIGGQLYLAYSAVRSFSEGDYAASGVHAAATGAAIYGGPWGWAASALMELGLAIKKAFFGKNLKRSYLGREYTYSEYSPDTGWGAPEMEQYKDKRKGEKAFGESAESMAQTGQDLMNAMDDLFKSLLGSFGEKWENMFKAKMIDLAAAGLSFDFYISAEDKSEFKDDWRKSWADLAKELIDPIIDVGSDLLSQALDGAVTDATAWIYFTEEMREYLKTSLEDSLADLKVDWSAATNQEEFEAALKQMGMAAENIKAIIDYFTRVGDIMNQVSDAISLSEFSGPAQAAIQSLRDINAQFDAFSVILDSLGVDLKKYIDLEIARNIAIENAVKAMSDASISGEDLALALKYMREEMKEAGHYAHEIADAMDAAFSAILESIADIEQRHEDYGKTAIELLMEKHPEWSDTTTYDAWAEENRRLREEYEADKNNYMTPYTFEEWLREKKGIDEEMLQDWRNLGFELEKLWEKMFDEAGQSDLIDIIGDMVDVGNDTTKELIKVLKEFRDFQVKLMSELFGVTGQGALALSPEQWKVVMADAFKDQIPGNMGFDLDIELIRNLMGLGQDYLNSMKMQFTSQYDWIKFVSLFLKDIDHIMMQLGNAGSLGRKTFGYDMDRYFYEPSRGLTGTGEARFEHFASGGWHEGGLRIVGEQGPELEYTPPTRIYSAGDTHKILDGGDMLKEIKNLRKETKETKEMLNVVAKNSTKQADVLRRWEFDGLPPERT